ncbi:MAG: LysR substrate-binding domain-containing protein [Salinisphaera sp.]|jgi:DNA-binding transcriptional LysR family regulator|nr:LysR substrate-binding domain-containing protein [Salinisphaera sp.]
MNALEARLGVTLVHRTTRRLTLSEAGARYLDRAERFLDDLKTSEADVTAHSVAVSGHLRVSVPSTFGVLYVADLASAFQSLYPAVTIELDLNDRFVDLLQEGWDTAIRIGRLADSSLVARKLADMRLVVCGSPEYLSRHGLLRTLDDLAEHDCLGYTLTPSTGPTYWSFGRNGSSQVAIRGSLHANNGEALIRAAIAGQGLVYGPRFIAAPALADGTLV